MARLLGLCAVGQTHHEKAEAMKYLPDNLWDDYTALCTEIEKVRSKLQFWRVLALGFLIIGTICFAILK